MQRAPALLLRRDDGVDEHDQARGDGHRAREVEAPVGHDAARLGDVAQRGERGADPDGDVDDEDPRPAEDVGQDAAEEQAEGAAGAGDRAPDAHRAGAVLALGEGGGDDRQRRGGDQGGAEALHAARDDQHLARVGERVGGRRRAEERDADQEQPAAADEVGGAAAEEQEAAEHQRVGVDDPLQLLGAQIQIGLDRRQGDVDDRRVEHDHELREADDDEGGPAGTGGEGVGHEGEGLLENRIGESVSPYQSGLPDPLRVTGITERAVVRVSSAPRLWRCAALTASPRGSDPRRRDRARSSCVAGERYPGRRSTCGAPGPTAIDHCLPPERRRAAARTAGTPFPR